MSKLGVIYCGFGDVEYTKVSIPVWLEARDKKVGDTEWIIAGVSVPFKEYEDTPFANDESTTEYLKTLPLNYLVTEPKFVSEAEARNKALFYLLEQNCDWVILADSDEAFTLEHIENISEFLNKDKFTTWLSFSYKNYVFADKNYLEDPFTPPRAFRVKSNSYRLDSFYHDNEVKYHGTITRDVRDFRDFSSKNIPKSVNFVPHFTWPSNERGRLKCEYQTMRWGDLCSFKWNYEENKLEFNPDYYKRFNKPFPVVLEDRV